MSIDMTNLKALPVQWAKYLIIKSTHIMIIHGNLAQMTGLDTNF